MELHAPGVVVKGRYLITGTIAEGGMGAVYRARDCSNMGAEVALKQMLEEIPQENKDLAERITKEGKMLGQLYHPSIPRVVDYFWEAQFFYVVMEYVDGEALDDVVHDLVKTTGRALPVERALRYAIQICDVLEYLHKQPRPIIHRDLKPQNILLRRDRDEVVLVDFGIARSVASAGTNTMVGTLGYAPLEQVKGYPEPRSDLYALGATLHHLLTGKVPTPFQLPLLNTVVPGLDQEVSEIVALATREKPNQRYVNAARMGQALREAYARLTGATPVYSHAPTTSPAEEALFEPSPPSTGRLTGPMSVGAFMRMCASILLVAGGILWAVVALRQGLNQPVTPPSPSPSPTADENMGRPDPGLPGVAGPPPRAAIDQSIGFRVAPPSPELAGSASGWLTAAHRGGWQCIGVLHFASGQLQPPPGQPAAVMYVRPETSISRLTFSALRTMGTPSYRVMVGNLGVHSMWNGKSYVSVIVDTSGNTLHHSQGGIPDEVRGAGTPPFQLSLNGTTAELTLLGSSSRITLDHVTLQEADKVRILMFPAQVPQSLVISELTVQ